MTSNMVFQAYDNENEDNNDINLNLYINYIRKML